MQNKKILLKDQLFNKEKVVYLSQLIKNVFSSFDNKLFEIQAYEKFDELELKQRMFHLRDLLYNFLPNNYDEAIDIILKSLPQEMDPNKTDNDFGDFIFAPFGEYVAKYGCNEKYLNLSFEALEELTKRFTVEGPIRSFFNSFENETLEQMMVWSKSDNYHVRRLASEGSRPKLPWAEKIKLDYKKTENILDNLYYDKARFVTRSLANHLNDISKIDPDFVIYLLKKWQKENKQDKKELDFIIKHSLRTLIKLGSPNALELIGIEQVDTSNYKFKIHNPVIKIGEKLDFEISFKSLKKQNLLIDYIVYFLNNRGTYNKKVHKLTKLTTQENKDVNISKKHLFDNFSTRKLNKGIHKIEIQINGKIFTGGEFEIA